MNEFAARGRRFELHRDTDMSGVSGQGVVADGVEYPDGFDVTWPDGTVRRLPPRWVLLTWRGKYSSTVLWNSTGEAMAVHGHHGSTRLVWLDEQ